MPATALSPRIEPGRIEPGRLARAVMPAAGLALAVALLAPALFGQQMVLGGDVLLYVLPLLALAGRSPALAPGWEPAVGLGASPAADLSLLAHDPWSWLAWPLDPPRALAAGLALRLALAFAGAAWLGRRLALSPRAAALAGLVYAAGGVAWSQVDVPPYAAGLAALPWTVLAVRAVSERPEAWRVAVGGVPPALAILAGAVEPAALGLLLGLGLALPNGARRAALASLGVGLAAAALAAAGLVPFLAGLPGSERALGLSWEATARWSLHPAELSGLLVPGLTGPGGLTPETLGVRERAWYASLYLGAAPLALALLGARAALNADGSRPAEARQARLLSIAGLLCLMWALGRFGPLVPPLYELLPPLRGVRYPAKAFVGTWLLLALLAGLGLDRTRGAGGARAARGALGGVALAAGVLAAAAALGGWAGIAWRALQPLAFAGAGLALARRGDIRRRLLLLAVVDLLLAGRASLDLVPRAVWDDPPALLAPALRVQDQLGAPLRVAVTPAARLPSLGASRLAGQRERRDALHPNTGLGEGLFAVDAFTGLDSARWARLREARRGGRLELLPWLVRCGAGLVVASRAEEEVLVELVPVSRWQGRCLARLPGALPWAALLGRAEPVADPAAACARVSQPGFRPGIDLVVEAPPGLDLPRGAPGPAGQALALRRQPDGLLLEVNAPAGGLLVVREAWAAGWTARVDGAPAPLLPADLLFRAVPVPPGARRVELRYEAPGQAAGLVLALGAWSGLVLLGGRALLRTR